MDDYALNEENNNDKEQNDNIEEKNDTENNDNKDDINIKEENENNNIIDINNIQKENIIQEDSISKEEKKIEEENINNLNINLNIKLKEEISEDNQINIQLESSKKEEEIKEEKKKEIQNNKAIINKTSEKLQNIPVYVYSVKSIEINSIQMLIYFIKGKLVQKEVLRTFNDFELFNQTLLDMWPCISVPGIYLKEESQNPNSNLLILEIKTKLLNHFFKKLSESKELLYCEATKIFLSQDKNMSKKLSNISNNINYKEISERYFKIFTYYIEDAKIIKEKEAFINRFIKLLEVTLKRLNEVGKTIENEIYNIKKELNSLDFVTSMFIDLEKSMPNKNKCLTNLNNTVKPLKSVSNIYLI